jgi:hypothetical protein
MILMRNIRKLLGPGVVAYTHNLSYSGGRDQEDWSLRQKVHKTSSQPMAGHSCVHLSSQAIQESTNGSMMVEAYLIIK